MAYARGKYGRDYKQEYKVSQSSPQDIADRAARNKARKLMEDAGKVHKGDGMDVDHKVPLDKGGKREPGVKGLRVQTASANRSYKRKSDGSVK